MLQVSFFLITFVKSYKMACFLALRFSETVKLCYPIREIECRQIPFLRDLKQG